MIVALATAAASLAPVEASALDTGTAEPVSVQASTLSVTLAEGASAQGLSSPDFGECESVHCRHLEITLSDAPAGNYTIECWSSLDDEPWYSGSWHWPSSSLWSAGGCWYGNPGQRVRVVVDGEMSNVVTWGQSSLDSGTTPDNPTTPGTAFNAVTAGGIHTCGLKTDATITCWGYNYVGQTDAPSGTFNAVTAGWHHTCGLRTDATITCWGWDGSGEADAPGGTFNAVTAGGGHTCGLKTDATITCWGDNDFGQTDAPSGTFNAVTAGGVHTCGLKTDDTITCWGRNDFGQTDAPSGTFNAVTARVLHTCGLKTDDTITCWGRNDFGQTDAPSGTFNAVTAGGYHTCGLKTDDTITCWGRNDFGQTDAPSGTFNAVTAGGLHTCGLKTDATITCWGDNSRGQIADPVGDDSGQDDSGQDDPGQDDPGQDDPGQDDPGLDDVGFAVAAGGRHTCAIRTDDTVTCWGSNTPERGFEHVGQSDAPVGTYQAVTAGGYHTCAIRTNNTITCWGDNGTGQSHAPSGTYEAVTAGRYHTCAIRTNNTITCWGSNWYRKSDAPSGTYQAVTAGGYHTCAIRTNNTITCWGYNGYGQTDAPADTYQAVTAGENHTCAVRTNNTITCWGRNWFGQTDAPGGTYQAVTASEDHTCAIRTDNTITCWGDNGYGQANAPNGTYQAVTAGEGHTCAVRTDDIIVCWGRNSLGQSTRPWDVTDIDYQGGHVVWEAVPGAESYDLTWKYVGEDQVALRDISCCRYAVERVPGKAIRVTMRAVDSNRRFPWSSWTSVIDDRELGRVEDISYTIGSRQRSGFATLSDDYATWTPIFGATSYDIEWEYSQDSTEHRDYSPDVSCTARQCRWDFLRNPEENLSIRVRAQRGSRTGPWSALKGVTLPVPRKTTIVDFEVKHQAVLGWFDFNGDHVVVSWDRDVDAASYKVEWRWQSFLKADLGSAWQRANPGVSPEVTADDDPLGALKQSLAILGTGGVTKFGPYSTTVGNVSQVEIENIANDGDRDENYQLQFRVTARNSAGAAGPPSEWRSLRNLDLLKLLRSSNAASNWCTVAKVADTAITAISLYRAVAKESAAALIELAATAAADAVAETDPFIWSIRAINGCYGDPNTSAGLVRMAATAPGLGHVLKFTGRDRFFKAWSGCNNFVVDLDGTNTVDFLDKEWLDHADAAGCPTR